MKKNKKQDQTFLFEQIENRGDLGFDYADIKNRVNVLQYEKKPASKAPKYRFRPQAIAVACSLLLVTTAIGFGGFMMSRRSNVVTPDTTVNSETIPSPESQPPVQQPVLFPEDRLIWQDHTYVRTSLILDEHEVGVQLGETVSSEADSGSQQSIRDNPQVAIAEHLEDGTPFHQVTDEETYIAVFSENNYVIYQRQCPPDTTTH